MNKTDEKYFKPAGTILYGRGMIAQLASELALLNVACPTVLTEVSLMKKALRAARQLAPGFVQSLELTSASPSEKSDFLILAGGRDLVMKYASDPRSKAIIPLSPSHLAEMDSAVTDYGVDFLVIDHLFIREGSVVDNFFRTYASAVTSGVARMPGPLNLPRAFSYSCRTRLYSGHESLENLPRILRDRGVFRPLILTDKGIVAAGLLNMVIEVLGSIEYELFDDIPADSSSRVVNDISSLHTRQNRDGLIALGGGSVLDTGKGVYLNVSLGADDLSEWAGSGRIPRLETPFFTIPTTSGTGSEVTKVAVIADDVLERKILYVSTNLQPDFAILDSRLTTSLPSFLTSITGMDALSHAVEAFTCLGKNPLSDQMAWTAIELIRDHLIPGVDDPQNREHRLQLAIASSLAGQAFSNSMVGMVHSIGHSVGALCHVPHGSCMSILLPYALEYNFTPIEPLLSDLLGALADPDILENTAAEDRAEMTIQIIRTMNHILREKTGGRHPERFSHLLNREGVPLVSKEQFPRIALTTMGDASIVYNPVDLGYEEILKVLEESY
ncbi:iron-containing alcohol dehydrogenase [Oceanispirochaeta crateris]|uniref:Iron-containing alcohol dehydrogenase n=1 Tax=Oceanispirochaeta crateris TaxID=2518645 RepID=A0A5C1QHQ2_9SPIO|nr:iron-containing alcohol dehydrogenase [Oceanispirochaeta crateris]QEN06520.1 iron-containing alcohol dehydrogenase [Oceanispirochaeta crateris]